MISVLNPSARSEQGNQRMKWGYLVVLPYFIAAIVVGALHWEDCPIQPQLPMLVAGTVADVQFSSAQKSLPVNEKCKVTTGWPSTSETIFC